MYLSVCGIWSRTVRLFPNLSSCFRPASRNVFWGGGKFSPPNLTNLRKKIWPPPRPAPTCCRCWSPGATAQCCPWRRSVNSLSFSSTTTGWRTRPCWIAGRPSSSTSVMKRRSKVRLLFFALFTRHKLITDLISVFFVCVLIVLMFTSEDSD